MRKMNENIFINLKTYQAIIMKEKKSLNLAVDCMMEG